MKIIYNNEIAKTPKVNRQIAQSKVNDNNGVAQSPPVNGQLTHDSLIQPSLNKKRKILEERDENKNCHLNSVLDNQGLKCEQNTFNNCVFNITYKSQNENKS